MLRKKVVSLPKLPSLSLETSLDSSLYYSPGHPWFCDDFILLCIYLLSFMQRKSYDHHEDIVNI
jgi:hypothetical protein